MQDPRVQSLAEEIIKSVQVPGDGVPDVVPTTGLYCVLLALTECHIVDVHGIGVGTIGKHNLSDLEYFRDADLKGWDERHDVEAERTVLRVLSSQFWGTTRVAELGKLRWHNPLGTSFGIVDGLLQDSIFASGCSSGIHC